MKTTTALFMVATAAVVTACGTNKEGPESTWISECPGQGFCFDRPTRLVPQDLQPIDSVYGIRTDGITTLTFDLGNAPLSLTQSVHSSEAITVAGRPGQLQRVGNLWVLRVESAGNKLGFQTHLTMLLDSNESNARQIATRIFKSIELPR